MKFFKFTGLNSLLRLSLLFALSKASVLNEHMNQDKVKESGAIWSILKRTVIRDEKHDVSELFVEYELESEISPGKDCPEEIEFENRDVKEKDANGTTVVEHPIDGFEVDNDYCTPPGSLYIYSDMNGSQVGDIAMTGNLRIDMGTMKGIVVQGL